MYREAASKIIKIETERADLFDVSILIAMRIHISGNVTATEISEAFDVAVYANEILQSHVVVDPRGKAYYDVNGFSNSSIEFEDNDWKTILRREEKKRFRIEEGEFIRAFCYESEPDGCGILFLMHHLGGDGLSLVYFIETFMKALSGEEPEDREIRTIPAGAMDEKSLKDRIGPAAMVSKSYNKKWNKEELKRSFGYFDMDEAYDAYWSERKSLVNEYVIKPEIRERILKRCKEWDIRFTAYITTCFLRRMARKMDIGFAIDAREDNNRSMGNQASGISLKYKYNYNRSFKQNAIKVQRLMDEKLEDKEAREFILPFMASIEPTLVDAINLEHAGTFSSKTSKAFAKMMGYGKKTKDLSITNLTRLDIPDTYGDLKIDFFSFIPPVVSYGRNIVGISTLGDCTVMTIHRVLQ
ncbi:MAG: hypothetical protein J5517_09760 [Eubacterium sp.]|nr:hypothetical protein [Eubacterium sp.]